MRLTYLQTLPCLALLTGWCQFASADETSAAQDLFATLAASADLTPPAAPGNLSWTTNGATVLLSWQASTDDTGVVAYDLYYGNFYLGAFTDTSVAMIGFKPGTPYSFTVKARDAAGNTSVASNAITVLLNVDRDTTPPSAPTNLAAGTVTTGSVALSWTASTDDVGVVVYQVYAGGTSPAGTATSTRATVSNLAADTSYTFTVKALDAAGNASSASSSLVVRTKTAPDMQAPTAPTNLTSPAQSTSSITLTWSASSDNVGVTAYDVYRGTTLAGSVSSTTFDDSGLQPDTAYTYSVQARDAAGNVSSASASLTARTTTTGTGNATFMPDSSWSCGMTVGIPPPTQGDLVFRAVLQLGPTQNVGATQYGQRRVLDVKGGTVTGSRLQATVLAGGFDFELTLSNGVIEQEQIDMLRASDGTIIYMRTCGVAPANSTEVRIVPDFEVATSSSLAWLNSGKFVGTRTINASAGTMELDVYDVSKVAVGSNVVQITKPSGVPKQPWDCSTTTGSKGASVFTENVTLGSTLSVGASKRGTRNVIPITGGTVTGRLTGTIVSGGADYQLTSGGPTKLDAKYVLASNDGEYVVVRNCGPFGALVPQFETRAAGPYAFLNSNTYVSSDPGSGSGGVSITFYQRQ